MKTRLTTGEMIIGVAIGIVRNFLSIINGYKDKHGATGPGWGIHIEGACGEVAFAKVLGVFWSPTINTFKNGHDVAGYQVRTRSNPDWDLIIRKDDKPACFVLVLGQCPDYDVFGFIDSEEARKVNDWISNHGDRESAWFVPQSALTAIEQLTPIARPS